MAPLQIGHGKNTHNKGMGLNVWNIVLEAKYKIRLEHGKEDTCFTYKSLTSKLPHHQFVVAKSCFSGFHLLIWIHDKIMTSTIQASNDLWSSQDFEPWQCWR